MRRPQNKKKQKLKYWELQIVLDSLRLDYTEVDKDKSSYRVDVPLFGIRFRLLGYKDTRGLDNGWDVFYLDIELLEKDAKYFLDDLMWLLVEKGYMAFIRESDRGVNGRIFRNILIDNGWGQKIIERRIQICGDEPRYNFMKTRMEGFSKLSVPVILGHYEEFFDYLI